MKVASQTSKNGFYKPITNNFFEDNKQVDNDFDKYFNKKDKESRESRNLNENERKFINVRKQHENKELEFRDKIIKEKERIKKNELTKRNSEVQKNSNLLDKEVLLFNESFNNISLIEQLDKIEGIDDIADEKENDYDRKDSIFNFSMEKEKENKDDNNKNKIINNFLHSNVNNNKKNKNNVNNINNINNINNMNNKNNNKIMDKINKIDIDNSDEDDNIIIENMDNMRKEKLGAKPSVRNSSKMIENSTKISKNDHNDINDNNDNNDNNEENLINEDKKDEKVIENNKEDQDDKKVKNNIEDQDDLEIEAKHEKLENLLCENKFSKSGANFFPKIQPENVPDLLKRILEKNKKEASVRQRDGFTNMTNQKNQNLNKNGNFILNMERPRTQHSSKSNPYLKKEDKEKFEAINFEIGLSDMFFWRKHEEVWEKINSSSGALKTYPEFDNYFIPKFESEILQSIFFKTNGIIKDKIEINDKIFNPKHEIKKWKDAYKIAIKRWHPDKLIPLLSEIQITDDLKNSYILKKCGSILDSINKSINTVVDILKKIANKQAPKL